MLGACYATLFKLLSDSYEDLFLAHKCRPIILPHYATRRVLIDSHRLGMGKLFEHNFSKECVLLKFELSKAMDYKRPTGYLS